MGEWHAAAAATRDRKRDTSCERQIGWAVAAKAAVRAGRPVIEGPASSVRPEEAGPARELLRVMDGTPPFPEL